MLIYFALKKMKSEKAVTLIELVITLAMLSMFLGAAYSLYFYGIASWRRGIDAMEYQQTARISLEKIISELQYAHMVEIRDNNPKRIYYYIYLNNISCEYRFRFDSGRLMYDRLECAGSKPFYTVVALGITALHFNVDDNGYVTIDIAAGDDNMEVKLTGSVRPRNLPRVE